MFSTLDLNSGYWQIPVAPKDHYKTAFTCHRGLFEFKRKPFSLSNAPNVFQRIMDRVLHQLISVCYFVYIDAIIINSRNAEEHAHHLKLVMDRLRQAGLKVKLDKCRIAHTKVKLLGYIVGTDGITSNPEKNITTMTAPTSVTAVRRFLGMTWYYRHTIPDYAKIAVPLIALKRKGVTWERWTAEVTPLFIGGQVYLFHWPITCQILILKRNASTKIQRWAVLIAKFGADIQYREGKNNIRADMLSRLHCSQIKPVEVKNYIEHEVILIG